MGEPLIVEPIDGHGVLSAHELDDRVAPAHVRRQDTVYRGYVWDVRQEEFDHPSGRLTRDYVRHPGAVATLAMRGSDGNEEILLIQQYRHPIGTYDWEIPAGLLDVAGEPPHVGAARELYEEADLRARTWNVLVDFSSSPGGSSEQLRVFLARDIEIVPEDDRHHREAEELNMPTAWAKLDDVVEAIAQGRLHNPGLIVGAQTAYIERAQGWKNLRPADAPWPIHPAFAEAAS